MIPMKHITVSAALILSSDDSRIFTTQRGYGDWKGFWEFPGGKLEPGESPEDAIVREIHEELDTQIAVDGFEPTVDWDYPSFHLTMHCFWCHVVAGDLTLKEHTAARWLSLADLDSVDWLPADRLLLPSIRQHLS